MERILIDNLDKLHTTPMGEIRIKRNLSLLDEIDVIEYAKSLILNKNAYTIKKGKNYYVSINDIVLTINSYSYTIITAKRMKIFA